MFRKLYAVGGKQNDSILNFAECYDPSNNTWSEIAPLPQPLSNCASVSYQGKLYILGGLAKSDQVVNTVFR